MDHRQNQKNLKLNVKDSSSGDLRRYRSKKFIWRQTMWPAFFKRKLKAYEIHIPPTSNPFGGAASGYLTMVS